MRGSGCGAPADKSEFGVDEPLELEADLFEVGPKTLLYIQGGAFELDEEVGMLAAHQVAEVRFHQRDAMLEGALQIRDAAKELDLVGSQFMLPLGAPGGPMGPQVLDFRSTTLEGLRAALELAVQTIEKACDARESPVVLVQRLQEGVEGGHDGAVELNLLADVPIQGAGEEALDKLDGAVDKTGRAGIDRADCSDLAFRSIACMEQRHQVGEGNLDGARDVGIEMARAHAVPNLADEGRDLFGLRACGVIRHDGFSEFEAKATRR